MKILHLISSSGYYGAEKVLVELSRAAAQAPEIDKTYAGIICNSANPHTEICSALRGSGVLCVLFACSGKLDISTVKEIRSFIKKEKIDVIHSHGYKSNFYALAATLFLKVKKITTVHNWITTGSMLKLYAFIDKALLHFFDRIIVVSAPLLNEVAAIGVPQNKVRLIANGTDIDGASVDSRALRASFGIAPGAKVIGTVGRMSVEKGHEFLISAAEEVLKKHPGARFVFVGDGPLKEQYMAKVKRAGETASFIFTGSRTNIHALLSMMDVFVLPSLQEGMPMALLEAMAARTAIIATRVGSVASILEKPDAGIVVEPGDAQALADGICTLLQDKKLAELYANEAFYKVSKDYSLRTMFGKYMEAYS